MAFTERYANFDLATGSDDGTTEADAWKTLASMLAGWAAGDRINIKRQASPYGPITSDTTIGPGTPATAATPTSLRGYTSTIGDGGIWEAKVSTAGILTLTFGAYCKFEGVSFSGASGSTNMVVYTAPITSEFHRCVLDVTDGTAIATTGGIVVGRCSYCKLILARGRINSVGVNGGSSWFRNCYIRRIGNASTNGHILFFDMYDRPVVVEGCHIIGNGLTEGGIRIDRWSDAAAAFVSGNRFFGVQHGIDIDEEPNHDKEWGCITHNVFSTMSGYAINRNNTQLGYLSISENLYHDCTSGFTNYDNFVSQDNNTSLSADPFEDSSAGDLSFNDVANGGAVCRARGFPMQDAYDWDNLQYLDTQAKFPAADIAAAVWTRAGRSLTA